MYLFFFFATSTNTFIRRTHERRYFNGTEFFAKCRIRTRPSTSNKWNKSNTNIPCLKILFWNYPWWIWNSSFPIPSIRRTVSTPGLVSFSNFRRWLTRNCRFWANVVFASTRSNRSISSFGRLFRIYLHWLVDPCGRYCPYIRDRLSDCISRKPVRLTKNSSVLSASWCLYLCRCWVDRWMMSSMLWTHPTFSSDSCWTTFSQIIMLGSVRGQRFHICKTWWEF